MVRRVMYIFTRLRLKLWNARYEESTIVFGAAYNYFLISVDEAKKLWSNKPVIWTKSVQSVEGEREGKKLTSGMKTDRVSVMWNQCSKSGYREPTVADLNCGIWQTGDLRDVSAADGSADSGQAGALLRATRWHDHGDRGRGVFPLIIYYI